VRELACDCMTAADWHDSALRFFLAGALAHKKCVAWRYAK
jgi:hypothetical protein